MKENIIKTKSFAFALRIVNLCKFLKDDKREFVMSKQLLRSGTAVGALVRESEQAESTADFIHKLSQLSESPEYKKWQKKQKFELQHLKIYEPFSPNQK